MKKAWLNYKLAFVKVKKTYDKRESLKEQDTKRDLERIKKSF